MEIFDDSFSIELNYPLDEEARKILEDAELDNTEHIWFKTPRSKRVDFIKADVLDKIIAEIIQMPTISPNANDIYKDGVLAIINKYKAERSGK